MPCGKSRTAVYISRFLGLAYKLNKNSQRWYFAWENLRGGFCCWHFIFVSSFHFLILILLLFFTCRCSSFTFSFRHHSSLFRGLSPGFYTHFILSAQPIAEWSVILSFSTFPWSWALRFWVGVFYPQVFFILPTFLTQPDFIKDSLGAGSSSLKFAGLHTDPENTGRAHLFVWFTVIHKLHIQNNSYVSSTIY